ncbi:hypothetical protein [Photobacterium kishitanii]|uniref:Uncharacterized protein n=1 Tax=Photobacterium kishitanii TaxID=318456 RepID=A0A2T3KLD8_9GAMM|nr:hypothetical protein [Photobacterium kishitanii]PSV00534.1 hypothetical protein C9J27_05210 [Photobacterium kishitanii]
MIKTKKEDAFSCTYFLNKTKNKKIIIANNESEAKRKLIAFFYPAKLDIADIKILPVFKFIEALQ